MQNCTWERFSGSCVYSGQQPNAGGPNYIVWNISIIILYSWYIMKLLSIIIHIYKELIFWERSFINYRNLHRGTCTFTCTFKESTYPTHTACAFPMIVLSILILQSAYDTKCHPKGLWVHCKDHLKWLNNFFYRILVTCSLFKIFNFVSYANITGVTSHRIMTFWKRNILPW
jgi:hypothetical protein